MKQLLFFMLSVFSIGFLCGQNQRMAINGKVQDAANDNPMSNVHIINVNSVKGVISDRNGNFEISAEVNDTLYFSFIGYKSLKATVTNDWLNYGNINIKLTKVGIALEELVISSHGLTGFLDVDAHNIPVFESRLRYAIPGLEVTYEGDDAATKINRALTNILNPINPLASLFNKKKNQLKKLRKIKKDEEIRNLLQDKFDRETLTTLLQLDKVDIDQILRKCNYSKSFIKTANDLQILDAISECYEEHKVLSR